MGRDSFLPPISADRLTESAIRARAALLGTHTPSWQPEFAGDGANLAPGREPADASVLIGLVRRDAGLHVLLTQRTAHLRDHAGQVSFPGGRRESSDADAAAAALREAHEEIGLEPALVEVLGHLPAYTTVTRFVVTPVMAFVNAPSDYRPDRGEVAAVFEVPLAFLMNPANHQRHRFEWDGQSRDFLAMPWPDATAPDGERFIWGATAAMLRNLYRLLAAS